MSLWHKWIRLILIHSSWAEYHAVTLKAASRWLYESSWTNYQPLIETFFIFFIKWKGFLSEDDSWPVIKTKSSLGKKMFFLDKKSLSEDSGHLTINMPVIRKLGGSRHFYIGFASLTQRPRPLLLHLCQKLMKRSECKLFCVSGSFALLSGALTLWALLITSTSLYCGINVNQK